MIHPTAVIHPKAKLDSTVAVGPCAVIDEHVEVGPDCVVGPHVHLTGHTVIGSGNRFHAGAVIGDTPQDLKYRGEPTRLRIGDNNVFREHTVVNCSATLTEDTVIGSNNFIMVQSHVGHNSRLGDHVILGGGAMVAGHVTVEDRVFISGNCLVHQFCRIGTLSMMQGGAAISKDLPPFTIARGYNAISGLNTIGLRRAGISSADRLELRRIYHAVFRSGQNLRAAVADCQSQAAGAPARKLLQFLQESKRGFCAALRRRSDEAGSDED
ncbi:MAG: acyl-ACP--UDP-N-acetylglucosamine O-acyltransferase [Verrucomicrobiota bacterium]